MKTLKQATKEATNHLLRSKSARSYRRDMGKVPDGWNAEQVFTLDLERDGEGWLKVTTWGFDEIGIKVPQSRPELIRVKMLTGLSNPRSPVDQVAYRYYLDILRREMD